MNVLKLNEILSGDTDNIIQVLESMGFTEITEHRGGASPYLSFPNLDGDNKNACNIYIDSLNYNNYTRSKKGNIYTLVMDIKQINFPQSLDYISSTLGIDKQKIKDSITHPFGGFYKQIQKQIEDPEYSMPTYDLDILKEYEGKYSKLFFEDGINFDSQNKFNVGYDIWSNRITIPEFTFDGKLCGIMGRLNDKNCLHEERWLPIIPCSRNMTLFGYTKNYEKIKEKDICIIGESEKAPMQMSSMRCEVGLASCGNQISNIQAKYIKSLNTSKIILGYDEGLDEEYIREQAKKLVLKNNFMKNKVGYIYDKDHDILKKGSKNSPYDLGIKVFKELLKKYVTWI